jgi:hypothetical protein
MKHTISLLAMGIALTAAAPLIAQTAAGRQRQISLDRGALRFAQQSYEDSILLRGLQSPLTLNALRSRDEAARLLALHEAHAFGQRALPMQVWPGEKQRL